MSIGFSPNLASADKYALDIAMADASGNKQALLEVSALTSALYKWDSSQGKYVKLRDLWPSVDKIQTGDLATVFFGSWQTQRWVIFRSQDGSDVRLLIDGQGIYRQYRESPSASWQLAWQFTK